MEEPEEDDELVDVTSKKLRPWAPPLKPSTPSLWRRGLDLGKKFAVAGAAITSAPVVIPPLLVGLAFAFPFGVYLASYAYTDRVMRALLSPPEDEIEGYEVEGGRGGGRPAEHEVEIEMWLQSAVEDRHQFSYAADGESSALKSDDKAITLLVEEGEAKESREDENGIVEVEDIEKAEREDSIEHNIEMWPPSTEPEVGYGHQEVGQNGVDGEVKILRSSGTSAYMGEGTRQDKGKADSEQSSSTAPLESESAMVLPLCLSAVEDQSSDIAVAESEPVVGFGTREVVHSHEARAEEEGVAKEQRDSGRTLVDRDESAVATGEQKVTAWLPRGKVYILRGEETLIAAMGCRDQALEEEVKGKQLDNSDKERETDIKPTTVPSVDIREDMVEDSWMVEDKKSMHVGGEEENEKREKMGDTGEKVELNEETEMGGSEHSSNVDKKTGEESEETRAVTVEVVPESEENTVSSKGLSADKNANETVVEVILAGGPEEQIEDAVQDASPVAVEASRLPPSLHHSSASAPLESDIEFEQNALSSGNELDGGSAEAVEDHPPEERVLREKNEANQEVVSMEEKMEAVQGEAEESAVVENHDRVGIILGIAEASEELEESKTVEADDVFQQYEVVYGGNGSAFVTLGINEASEDLEEIDTREGAADLTAPRRTDESVITVCHSVVTETSPDREMQSSLSTENQFPDVTVAENEPAAIVVETVPYTEEMIWEQINAMRTIVGCKAAVHPTLVEELRALYLFTGVEPPESLKVAVDPGEVGDKLQFLKSVIGVK